MRRFNRRGFLRQTLGSTWLGASLLEQALFRANQARAQSRAALPALFDLEKMADGVYAAIARPAVMLNCNAVIFEQSNDLLVVDTHSKPSAVNALVAQIRRELTSKPVRYVVNSHFHWDHSQGNAAYRHLASKPEVIASEATRQLLSKEASKRLKDSLESTGKSLENYQTRLSRAKEPAEQEYWKRMIQGTRDYEREMRDYTPELPNLTLERDLILHDRAHDLHLAFRGRGHTAGDVVVYCPQKRVLAAGDLCHAFGPYLGDGYPREWPRTLLQVAEFDIAKITGGHGPVQPTRDLLFQKGAYIEELAEQVSNGKRSGAKADDLQKRITPDQLRSLQSGFGETMTSALLRYTMNPPSTTPALLLASTVASHVGQMYTALDRT